MSRKSRVAEATGPRKPRSEQRELLDKAMLLKSQNQQSAVTSQSRAKPKNRPDIPISEREAFSVDEAAAKLGVCRATLYNAWRKGEGPRYFKICNSEKGKGGRRLITPEALADYIRLLEARTATAEKP
jgi:hypothetical protein